MPLKQLRKEKTPDNQTAELVKHAEQLDQIPILDGVLVRVLAPSGDATPTVRHSLGRAYRGAFIAAVSSTATPFSEFYVAEASELVAQGGDPKTHVLLGANLTPTADHNLLLWVF